MQSSPPPVDTWGRVACVLHARAAGGFSTVLIAIVVASIEKVACIETIVKPDGGRAARGPRHWLAVNPLRPPARLGLVAVASDGLNG